MQVSTVNQRLEKRYCSRVAGCLYHSRADATCFASGRGSNNIYVFLLHPATLSFPCVLEPSQLPVHPNRT